MTSRISCIRCSAFRGVVGPCSSIYKICFLPLQVLRLRCGIFSLPCMRSIPSAGTGTTAAGAVAGGQQEAHCPVKVAPARPTNAAAGGGGTGAGQPKAKPRPHRSEGDSKAAAAKPMATGNPWTKAAAAAAAAGPAAGAPTVDGAGRGQQQQPAGSLAQRGSGATAAAGPHHAAAGHAAGNGNVRGPNAGCGVAASGQLPKSGHGSHSPLTVGRNEAQPGGGAECTPGPAAASRWMGRETSAVTTRCDRMLESCNTMLGFLCVRVKHGCCWWWCCCASRHVDSLPTALLL